MNTHYLWSHLVRPFFIRLGLTQVNRLMIFTLCFLTTSFLNFVRLFINSPQTWLVTEILRVAIYGQSLGLRSSHVDLNNWVELGFIQVLCTVTHPQVFLNLTLVRVLVWMIYFFFRKKTVTTYSNRTVSNIIQDFVSF